MTRYFANAELEREEIVRTVACSLCHRPARQNCVSTGMSHTARYNLAAERGLVPALRPIPTQECTCH